MVRGETSRFSLYSLVFVASCIAMAFLSLHEKEMEVCFLAFFSRYPTYHDEEGTGCWFILSFFSRPPVYNIQSQFPVLFYFHSR
jgi:hypothetical protein